MYDPRSALDAIGQLPDDEIDIGEAALALARIDAPDADWRASAEELSAIARGAAALAQQLTQDEPAARAGALAGLLAGRHRYRGDDEDYDNLDNANLIRVIERRCGLPVALGILWLHAAQAAGWNAHGVDFPGHFLVALNGRGGAAVVDVFAGGRVLGADELRALIRRVEGPRAELRPGLLAPMATRRVLLRLQNNVRGRRLAAGDVTGALACAEDMLRFAPDDAALWRETAQLHRQLDHVAAALRCLQRFLELAPSGIAAARARAAMEELRSRLN